MNTHSRRRLAKHIPGWRILRAIVFIPFAISGAAYALVFSLFYNPRSGLLGNVLGTAVLITLLGYLALFDLVYILT